MKAPVLYVLEYGNTERGGELSWSPLLDRESKPITFRGRGSKSKAIKFCQELVRHQVYDGVRVLREFTEVWKWTQP